MFSGCTSLTTAPELPATTLAGACYAMMFLGCTQLTTAPELLATTLVNNCYTMMFANCQKLNKVKVHFKDWNESKHPSQGWLSGVSPTGTFIYPEGLEDIRDADHIPVGWNKNSMHSITLTQPEAGKGTLSCSVLEAESKDAPRLSYDPGESTYAVDHFEAYYLNTEGEKVGIDVAEDGTFTMPDADVYASVILKETSYHTITKGQSDHVSDYDVPKKEEEGIKIDLPLRSGTLLVRMEPQSMSKVTKSVAITSRCQNKM